MVKYAENGAGDSYAAGFVLGYLKTSTVKEAMRFASICGAFACSSELIYNPLATESHVASLLRNFDRTFPT